MGVAGRSNQRRPAVSGAALRAALAAALSSIIGAMACKFNKTHVCMPVAGLSASSADAACDDAICNRWQEKLGVSLIAHMGANMVQWEWLH